VIAHLTFGNAWFSSQGWTLDPKLWIFVFAAVWAYSLGRRRLRAVGAEPPAWRAAMFYGGIAVTVFALESPFDSLADSLLSVHMVQHMLLLVVAAPLFAASTPWPELRRAMPPAIRAWLERAETAADGTGPFGRIASLARHPATALFIFAGVLWLWHLPSLYDLAVRDDFVHDQEHLSYLAAGVLYWSHAFGGSWLAARLPAAQRIAYLAAGMVPFNLAIGLAVLRMLSGEEEAARAEAQGAG
jgi:cytochrome c oxidase assembly factor CtaG